MSDGGHPLLPADVQAEYRRLGHWEQTTLADIVQRGAHLHPDRIAITGETQLTYGQLWEQARRLAGTLAQAGLEPGEFVLGVMSSSWQGVVLQVATSVAGAALAPRSVGASPTEALNTFEQLSCRGLVIHGGLLEKPEWRAMVAQMGARLDGRPVMVQGEGPQSEAFSSKLEQAVLDGPPIDSVRPAPCQPCLVLSTGGTTGTPKSIVHCTEALVYAARQFGAATAYSERDVQVAFAPYGHAGGSVFDVYMPLLFGASILPIGRWRAEPVSEAIERWGGTYFITMGTHIYDLLGLEPRLRARLRSVRVVTSGAGPDSLFEDGERKLGFPIVRVYGCSECPGHAIGRLTDPAAVRLRQDGVPFPGLEYRILDPSGAPAPHGRAGEYQCRAPNLFMGYAGQPQLTAETVTEDGFYRSGDLMAVSAEGYVSWNGRTKDIIRRAGLQIDPIEMEAMLGRHPKIAMVVVVGEPHPRLGERAVIVAVPEREEEELTLEELCAHLIKEGLPRQSLPERLLLTDDLPRTELGKFHRVEIKRRVATQSAPSAEPVV
jgi:acyl-coenzyme A synthetase/AMP-(fatty) acid ligase